MSGKFNGARIAITLNDVKISRTLSVSRAEWAAILSAQTRLPANASSYSEPTVMSVLMISILSPIPG